MNCQTAGLDCVFASGPPTSVPSTPTVGSETATASASDTSTPDQQPQGQNQVNAALTFTPSEASDTGLNVQHLELLHQFVTATYLTFSDDEAVQDVWKVSIVRMALSHQYLMYEILAMSALHLAYCRPEHSTYYYHKSTELQTQALNSFNSVQREVSASSCAPFLIFTSLLAVHVLADPSRTIGFDASQYLDHIIHCIMLMRDVQKSIVADWYTHLKDSELRPILDLRQPPKPYQIPQPCLDLIKLTDNPDFSEEAKEAYSSAIDRLQWTYAVSNVPNESYNTVRWLLAWPIQLSGPYQDRLNQRRPEAMVILAYYAVVMHFYRSCWCVGASGQFLIRAISSHLGPHWATWMEWPLSFFQDTCDVG